MAVCDRSGAFKTVADLPVGPGWHWRYEVELQRESQVPRLLWTLDACRMSGGMAPEPVGGTRSTRWVSRVLDEWRVNVVGAQGLLRSQLPSLQRAQRAQRSGSTNGLIFLAPPREPHRDHPTNTEGDALSAAS